MKTLRLAVAFAIALNLPLYAQLPPGVPPMSAPVMITPAGGIINPVFTNVTVNGVLYLADGSAAAPSLTFASTPTTGLFLSGGGNLVYTRTGTGNVVFGATAVSFGSNGTLAWTNNADPTAGSNDLILARDAANTLALRNGTTVQTFKLGTQAAITAPQDKLFSVLDTTAATGVQLNSGSPSLGTCTGGSITAGSNNMIGEYTGNTSSSCVINFGSPAWQNAPICQAMSEASTTHPRISARTTNSITVTGGVSGEAITWTCLGRVGTPS